MSGTVSILPPAATQFCDANGAPLAGGSVATYVPGTTTPATTWQDSVGTVPNQNPIILDAAGRAIIWGAGSYRMVLKDVAGNLIYDQVTSAASSTLSQLTVTGAVSVGGNVSIAGNETIGGTLAVTGAANLSTLAISQNGSGTITLPTAAAITRVAGTVADSDLTDITQTVTYVGGTNLAQALQVKSTVGNTYIGGVYSDAPGANVWNLTARLYSTACRYSAAGPVGSQHVAFMSGAYKNPPPGGVPSGHVMAEIWARNTELYDYTNLPSSQTNTLCADEIDCAANNLDDGGHRFGDQYIVGPMTALSNGGYPCEWNSFILFSGHAAGGQADGFVKFGINAAVPYSISLFDARTAGAMNTTVAATLGSPSTTISVANVWGFTSAGPYGYPVSSTNQASITINGHAYSQTGFTTTAGSTAGTITLTTPVSIADGTVGNVVAGQSRTIWLDNGQQIALSTDGTEYIFVDSTGAFNFIGYSGTLMKVSAAGETLVASLNAAGGIGLYGKTDPGQQTLSYSRSTAGETAAVAAIRVALAAYGIVKDSTTP